MQMFADGVVACADLLAGICQPALCCDVLQCCAVFKVCLNTDPQSSSATQPS